MFHSAKLKIKWAERHIANLERSVRAFAQTNSHEVNVSENTEGGDDPIVAINFGEALPIEFALIIGDIIHNLRTALDHANWELRGLDGGSRNKYTKLPVGKNRGSYEAFCKGIKTPTGDLPEFFKAREIFKGGKKKETVSDM